MAGTGPDGNRPPAAVSPRSGERAAQEGRAAHVHAPAMSEPGGYELDRLEICDRQVLEIVRNDPEARDPPTALASGLRVRVLASAGVGGPSAAAAPRQAHNRCRIVKKKSA